MHHWVRSIFIMSIVFATLMPAGSATAQMNTVFDEVFNGILIDQLSLSPGDHVNHYIPAAEAASANLTPALNRMIVRNISSLPLSSTIAGTVWEKAPDGTPQPVRMSWGPIYAETGATLGKGGVNVGVTYTGMKLDRLRGLNTRDIEFAFTHEDVDPDDGPLGTLTMESDVISVVMDLNVDSDVFALTGTYGLLSNLDVGFALPIIKLSIYGDARATVGSFTHAAHGLALHYFGGDPINPVLDTTQPYSESATGIGDVALRAKYSLRNTTREQYGFLVDVRLPTGAEEDFLGSGNTNANLMGIYSRTFNKFTPHVNLAYGFRGAEAESDDVMFAVGFDQSVSSKLSFAFDVLGLVPLDANKTAQIAPGTTTIVDNPPNASGGTSTRVIDNSNVPEFERDSTIDASFGFRYAPFDRTLLQANILLPMNDGGLRSGTTWMVGIAVYN